MCTSYVAPNSSELIDSSFDFAPLEFQDEDRSQDTTMDSSWSVFDLEDFQGFDLGSFELPTTLADGVWDSSLELALVIKHTPDTTPEASPPRPKKAGDKPTKEANDNCIGGRSAKEKQLLALVQISEVLKEETVRVEDPKMENRSIVKKSQQNKDTQDTERSIGSDIQGNSQVECTPYKFETAKSDEYGFELLIDSVFCPFEEELLDGMGFFPGIEREKEGSSSDVYSNVKEFLEGHATNDINANIKAHDSEVRYEDIGHEVFKKESISDQTNYESINDNKIRTPNSYSKADNQELFGIEHAVTSSMDFADIFTNQLNLTQPSETGRVGLVEAFQQSYGLDMPQSSEGNTMAAKNNFVPFWCCKGHQGKKFEMEKQFSPISVDLKKSKKQRPMSIKFKCLLKPPKDYDRAIFTSMVERVLPLNFAKHDPPVKSLDYIQLKVCKVPASNAIPCVYIERVRYVRDVQQFTDHNRIENLVYQVENFTVKYPYNPQIVRFFVHDGKQILETRDGMCPYCAKILFYNIKTSAYAQHLAFAHGISTLNLLTPVPLYPNIYMISKSEVRSAPRTRVAHTHPRPGVVCPCCYQIIEASCSIATKGHRPLTNYLRHFKEAHFAGKKQPFHEMEFQPRDLEGLLCSK